MKVKGTSFKGGEDSKNLCECNWVLKDKEPPCIYFHFKRQTPTISLPRLSSIQRAAWIEHLWLLDNSTFPIHRKDLIEQIMS